MTFVHDAELAGTLHRRPTVVTYG